MDTLILKAFLGIAEGITYYEMAEQIHMSQSSLSKSIIHLEEELGVKLFERRNRRVFLSKAGQSFYEDIKPLEKQFELAISRLHMISEDDIVNGYIIPSLEVLDIQEAIQRFRTTYPEIPISVENTMLFSDIAYQLEKGDISFVIMHKPLTDFHYEISYLRKDKLMVLLPPDSALARKEIIYFRDLQEETILVNSYTNGFLEDICVSCACTPRNIVKVKSSFQRSMIFSMVSYGRGVTLFFESDLDQFHLKDVIVKKVEGVPEMPLILAMPYGRQLKKNQQLFKNFLIQFLRRQKNNKDF